MVRRILAAGLWYLMVWVGYEILIAFVDWPRFAGPIAAAIVGGAIYLDPLHLLWGPMVVQRRAADRVALRGH